MAIFQPKKISELDPANSVGDEDILLIVDATDGSTKNVTADVLKTYALFGYNIGSIDRHTDVEISENVLSGQLLKVGDDGVWRNWTPNFLTSVSFSDLGTVNLDDLSDVTLEDKNLIEEGAVIKWSKSDGGKWVIGSDNIAESIDLSGYLTTSAKIEDLGNVTSANDIATGDLLKYNADTATWESFTPSYMTSYTLSAATQNDLGGVKIDGSTITINEDGVISANAPSYSLQAATQNELGGVRIDGSTITINGEGVISSSASSYTLPVATQNELGGVKIDNTSITINGEGVISSSASSYTLPVATQNELGGVKIDNTSITINEDGVISSIGSGGIIVSPEDYGAAGNGTTDDTQKFNDALTALFNAGGGTLRLRDGKQYLINGTVNVQVNCTIEGAIGNPGQLWQDLGGQRFNYGEAPGLFLGTSGKLVLWSSSTVKNTFVLTDAIKEWGYSLAHESTEVASFVSGWSSYSIAITSAGQGTSDCLVQNCAIAGFNHAVKTDSASNNRFTVRDVLIDCINGVDIEQTGDLGKLENCHAWQFITTNSEFSDGQTSDNVLAAQTRAGTAFRFGNTGVGVDWGKMTNCFSYGYAIGFHIDKTRTVTLLGCGVDNKPWTSESDGNLNSIGFLLSPQYEANLIGCQVAACYVGYKIDTDVFNDQDFPSKDEYFVKMTGCSAWDIREKGVFVNRGTVSINNCSFRINGGPGSQADYNIGIFFSAAAQTPNSKSTINGCVFRGSQNTHAINIEVGGTYKKGESDNLRIGYNTYLNSTTPQAGLGTRIVKSAEFGPFTAGTELQTPGNIAKTYALLKVTANVSSEYPLTVKIYRDNTYTDVIDTFQVDFDNPKLFNPGLIAYNSDNPVSNQSYFGLEVAALTGNQQIAQLTVTFTYVPLEM